ncbi:MAG: hypothetical protein ACI9IV_001901 [Paracoccaceae bacterium]|jgi:hypothetical protein
MRTSAPPQQKTNLFKVFRCAERVVPGDGTGGAWLAWLDILAGVWGILDLIQWIKSALRGDRIRTAVSDRVVASTRVVCAIHRPICNLPRGERSRCQSFDRVG